MSDYAKKTEVHAGYLYTINASAPRDIAHIRSILRLAIDSSSEAGQVLTWTDH